MVTVLVEGWILNSGSWGETMTKEYEDAYGTLNDVAENDLRNLEELVDEAMEEEIAMTFSSLPEGFKSVKTEEDEDAKGDFSFQASKEYEDGTAIEVQYEERTDSFGPDSSSVQIDVETPHTITHHWDQRR